MSRTFGKYGARWPRLGIAVNRILGPYYRFKFARKRVYRSDSRFAQERLDAMRKKLSRGETVYLAGLGPAGHNSGTALLEASTEGGLRLISNDEEERYAGVKHYSKYPAQTVDVLRWGDRLALIGVG